MSTKWLIVECSSSNQVNDFCIFMTNSAKNSVWRHVYILRNQLGIWILAGPLYYSANWDLHYKKKIETDNENLRHAKMFK